MSMYMCVCVYTHVCHDIWNQCDIDENSNVSFHL